MQGEERGREKRRGREEKNRNNRGRNKKKEKNILNIISARFNFIVEISKQMLFKYISQAHRSFVSWSRDPHLNDLR